MISILGTGQSGLAVLQLLLQRNPKEEMLVVNRSGKSPMILPENVQIIAADVTNRVNVEAVAQKSTLIFSCTDMPYQDWKTFYPATAEALRYALRKTTAKLVFADNLYSYGNTFGIEMKEEMAHAAQTQKGIIRAKVIEKLLYSGEDFNTRVAFVKASDFVGPHIHKGLFGTDFLKSIYDGKTIMLFGNIAEPHSFTYLKDFAMAMVNVGTADDTFGQVWHAPNAPALSIDKWVHLFEVIGNKKIKKSIMPKFVLRLAGIFSPFIKELYEMAYQFERPFVVNHDKYVSRFGNHATFPSEIVKETLDWYNSKNE